MINALECLINFDKERDINWKRAELMTRVCSQILRTYIYRETFSDDNIIAFYRKNSHNELSVAAAGKKNLGPLISRWNY